MKKIYFLIKSDDGISVAALILSTSFFLKNDTKLNRSSRPKVLCNKKGVVRNFAKFTGKQQCQSLFLLYSIKEYVEI